MSSNLLFALQFQKAFMIDTPEGHLVFRFVDCPFVLRDEREHQEARSAERPSARTEYDAMGVIVRKWSTDVFTKS